MLRLPLLPVAPAVVLTVVGLATVLQAQRGGPPRAFELRANDPAFNKLIPAAATLEKVAGGFGFTEGPVWDPRGGFLFFNDEQLNRVSRLSPDDGRVDTLLEIRDPDGAALDGEGRLIVCLSTLRQLIRIEPDGRYTVLAETYGGKRLNSINDVVRGPDNALYFTDPTIDLPKNETAELPTSVYRLALGAQMTETTRDGSVVSLGSESSLRALATDVAQPNGLAFSPDGRHLYVTDTERREIRVYDVTLGPAGGLANSRVFGKEEGSGGVPDGLKVDMEGNLYVTGPQGVWVWSPNGTHLGTIVLPETPANLAWGDRSRSSRDFSTLYFTARTSIYRLKTTAIGFVQH